MQSVFRIRELRQSAHMTQKELAEQMGYKFDSIVSMWESGERKPPSNLLPRLATVLDCTVDDLFVKSQ
ncbi:helix-turn-helix transcriptional regulator [Oscillospiraceae bacterium 42-9]